MSTAALITVVYSRWYTPINNMSNAILPHSLTVFAVGSIPATLVYCCYDLRPIYDTLKYYIQEEWNVTQVRPPVSHTVVYIPFRKEKWYTWYTCSVFSRFYGSMKTSRIIRVGTRNYILRIAAVSQEHVLECRTRRRNTAGQGHGSKVGIEINLVVVWVVEIGWISVWVIGVDLISV